MAVSKQVRFFGSGGGGGGGAGRGTKRCSGGKCRSRGGECNRSSRAGCMKRGELHQCSGRHGRHKALVGKGGCWVGPAGLALSADGSKRLQECKGCHKVSARQAQGRKEQRGTGAAYAKSQWAKTHENAQEDAPTSRRKQKAHPAVLIM